MNVLSSSPLKFSAPPGTAIRACSRGSSNPRIALVKRPFNALTKLPVYGIPDRLSKATDRGASRRVLRVQALFGFGKKPAPVVVRETIIPDPDARIPLFLLGAAGALALTDNTIPAVSVGVLGLLLLYQSTRIKVVFGDDAMEVRLGEELDDSGENVFIGGENRWKYESFINWEFWWPNFPVIVYFKESQTKPEGQIHFFLILSNGKQLYDALVERCGPSKTSGPK